MDLEQKKHMVNILWTGGYDSSFRMVQLSQKDVIIQPYYLSDNRNSEKNELNAIEEITSDIEKNPKTKCKILPIVIKNTSEVKPDNEITQSYLELKKSLPIGSQYEWLSRFAKEQNMEDLELSIEKPISGSGLVVNLFDKFNAKMNLETDGEISYYRLEKKGSDQNLYRVFGKFHYPSPLFDMYKTDMLGAYKKLGFENTIEKTWFCHTPIRNQPCGLCNPCESVIKEGLGFRLPILSRIRNKIKILYKFKYYFKKLIKKTIKIFYIY
ncbi:hypothetical protein LCGC14_0832060 [marine sediment metagenome]|uniref:Queuosine biosynthesis protein QueC n=2 Tax=root TaxID=1 RepID=A0A831R2E1_9GAMM|nr:7-cyano-7-deazaguanine synthase [Marinobacter antarcticus]HEA52661.1 hypothetical protein [Marinobacter antarcticus]